MLLLFCFFHQIACEPYPPAADNRCPANWHQDLQCKNTFLRDWQSKETNAKKMKFYAKLPTRLKKKNEFIYCAWPSWDCHRQSAVSTYERRLVQTVAELCRSDASAHFPPPRHFSRTQLELVRNISQLIYLSLHSLTWDRRVVFVVVVCCVSTA